MFCYFNFDTFLLWFFVVEWFAFIQTAPRSDMSFELKYGWNRMWRRQTNFEGRVKIKFWYSSILNNKATEQAAGKVRSRKAVYLLPNSTWAETLNTITIKSVLRNLWSILWSYYKISDYGTEAGNVRGKIPK